MNRLRTALAHGFKRGEKLFAVVTVFVPGVALKKVALTIGLASHAKQQARYSAQTFVRFRSDGAQGSVNQDDVAFD